MPQDPDLLIPKRSAQPVPTEVEELILTPPPPLVKPNRHVQIAINHMTKRKLVLESQIDKLTKEVDDIDTALKALG